METERKRLTSPGPSGRNQARAGAFGECLILAGGLPATIRLLKIRSATENVPGISVLAGTVKEVAVNGLKEAVNAWAADGPARYGV